MLNRAFIPLFFLVSFSAMADDCARKTLANAAKKSDLTDSELKAFFLKAYRTPEIAPGSRILIMTDVPPPELRNEQWDDRIGLLGRWRQQLQRIFPGARVDLVQYAQLGVGNADLTEVAYQVPQKAEPAYTTSDFQERNRVDFFDFLQGADFVFSGGRYSCTAPLSSLAESHAMKFISAPGFNSKLLPFLSLDYDRVAPRLAQVKQLVDAAEAMEVTFRVRQNGKPLEYKLEVDLRDQVGVAEPAMKTEKARKGLRSGDNAPIGEYYVSPREGVDGRTSLTQGIMPVQYGDEVVLFRVENNFIVEVLSQGPMSDWERQRLEEEPMMGNLAEMGFGILDSLGILPIDSDADAATLANEKLGFHIGRARSDHLQAGGVVTPGHFQSGKVAHLDHVYIPSMTPDIDIAEIRLFSAGRAASFTLMRDNVYTPETFAP